jgi:tetratricopeptide (TPR) repeat protein
MPRLIWLLLALLGVACATPEALRQSASAARSAGQVAEAIQLLSLAIKRQPTASRDERATAADLRRELASLSLASDDLASAERLYREALALLEIAPRGSDAAIINLRTQWAGLCYRQARLDEAAQGYRTVLDLEVSSLGAEHPDALGTMSILGGLELKRGQLEAAEALFRRQLVGVEKLYGVEKREVTSVLDNLADVHAQAGRAAEAARLRAEAARIRKKLCDEC